MDNVRAAIDLRNLTQMSSGTPVPDGVAIFCHDDPTFVPELDLGDNLRGVLSTVQRDGITQLTGVSSGWSGNKLWEVLAELLLLKCDPTGANVLKPVRGRRGRKHGHKFAGDKFLERIVGDNDPEWINRRDVFRVDYERARDKAVTQEDLDALRRWTGYEMLANNLSDPADILAPKYKNDGYLPPSTTLTESFDQSDSSTLGPDLSWTEISGNWETVSNQVSYASTSPHIFARADSDLSSDDHYCQLDVTSWDAANNRIGGGARVQTDNGTTETAYFCVYRNQAGGNCELEKTVSGTNTEITAETISASLPDTIKVQADGSSISGYLNGTEIDSANSPFTDTSITGYLRCGLVARGGPSDGDNWEAADLAAGGTTPKGVFGLPIHGPMIRAVYT
jgi:hypothetical protein